MTNSTPDFNNATRGALRVFLILAGTLWACALQAREYYVEMVIFERPDTRGASDELFLPGDAFSYPADYRFLTQTDPAQSNAGADNGATDITGRALLEVASSQHRLTREANALERRSGMRILFHKAWRQDLGPKATAPAVVINGGEMFDGRSELGGSVSLHLGKYIHINTDLWLTRFSTGATSPDTAWPIPPVAPYDAAPDVSNQTNFNNSASFDNSTNYAGISLGQRMRAESGLSNYAINEVITLKQTRRMRSNETHYLDHPRMGALILIVPATQTNTGE